MTDSERRVPAALVLPQGKFFFGFKYIPFDPSKKPKKVEEAQPLQPFAGEGNTVRRKAGATNGSSQTNGSNGGNTVEVEQKQDEEKPDPWAKLGSGNTLRTKRPAPSTPTPEAPSSRSRSNGHPKSPEIIDATMLDEDDFAFVEDDDVIEIDSD